MVFRKLVLILVFILFLAVLSAVCLWFAAFFIFPLSMKFLIDGLGFGFIFGVIASFTSIFLPAALLNIFLIGFLKKRYGMSAKHAYLLGVFILILIVVFLFGLVPVLRL